MRGSEDGELCTGIVDQQSSVSNHQLKWLIREKARTFDKSTQPQVCLLGPGPMSTYCITDKQHREYGRSGYGYIHSPSLLRLPAP